MKQKVFKVFKKSNFDIRVYHFLMALLCWLTLFACSSPEKNPAAQSVQLPGEDTVLATVNGSAITQYDLEQAMRTTLGKASLSMLDESGRKNLLESLAAAKAISQSQEKNLSNEDRAVLEKKVAAYREQLLVKMYLAENTTKEPVSQKMVEDYYGRHPEQFGGKTITRYELITSQTALPDARRDQLLAALQDADQQKNWAAWCEQLKQKGLAVAYKSGNADPAILTPDLREQLARLQPGQPADLAFSNSAISLARIIEQKKIPPRPLSEVSAQIRKMLLPVQLKKAVKQASDQVLKEAEVIYMDRKTQLSDSAAQNQSE